MSRKIKFRVWDKSIKKMHMCGEDGHDSVLFDQDGTMQYYNLQNGEGSGEHGDYELMQYTGLQDRNDKEIYRGDVLELTYVVTKGLTRQHRKFTTYVDWSDSILGFCLRNMDGTWNSEAHMYDFKANAEVIGNIYDHPHLLKGDDTDATT